MRILELKGRPPRPDEDPDRTGTFTSGIVATGGGHEIALFFTGRRHAGENLTEVLRQRAADLPPPVQMCDGLLANIPQEFRTILANCLAHARRKFIDVVANFPDECFNVLELLAKVYYNDKIARSQGLTPEERLRFHQIRSQPVMDELKQWMDEQLGTAVEPNSGLGKAIRYFKKRWDPLTLFLRVPGAPLDNNICERALKKAVLHRKNALFYKTCHGARVGDLFMSLIYTAERNGINPFNYLVALLGHHDDAMRHPGQWLPWNYHEALARLTNPPADDAGKPT